LSASSNKPPVPELIPAIDLRNGQVVRLRRGDYNDQTIYEVDPVDIAKKFEDAGCKWLHVVDLDGAREGRPMNLGIVEKIVRANLAQVLGLDPKRVGVKATTNELMGFLGRGEGMAALAVASVEMPE